ncbi:MAG: DUF3800 domain-containing protein [Winogradskyella sp.]|uniref:DUF3800 domain-containing protein n=1 Tax=Winogradskyella sp. TaxID=1883156 RepID=UPI00185EA37D|nr:DUF3800 domain-containing protein [Winogradskyella sp.]MBT8243883.1 DUF3800 domain-containing protein [Winogradskyella sp.]NNK22288.1 DUF3800 domain-containing protein [Winogradskyella sp.]
MLEKGDFIVYIDESGDHGLKNIDPNYSIFVLTFCCFNIKEYIEKSVPALQAFKFKYFGHDQVVLHETDIRKNKEPFQFLRTNRALRESFLSDLSDIIKETAFTIIPVVIDKAKLKAKYTSPYNPYHLGLRFGLEKLNEILLYNSQHDKEISLVFEQRGGNEDKDLELEFLRICSKNEQFGYKRVNFGKMAYRFLLANKKSNSSGLQLADLTAHPIGLKYLRPGQENRAYDIIAPKIYYHKIFP